MASKTVWGQTDDGLFEFVTLTDDLMEDALDVIREGFCRDESICLVTEVDRNPAAIEDLVELSRTAAADGVTVVAVERRTGIVAAVLFNKIQLKMYHATATNLLSLKDEDMQIFLSSFDTVLADCDGVLWRSGKALPGSPEVLNKFREVGKRVFYITNNSTKLRKNLASKATELGFIAKEEEILSTAYLTAQYLQNMGFKKKAFIVGSEGIALELEKVGISSIGVGPDNPTKHYNDYVKEMKLDDEVGAVIVGFDAHMSFLKVMRAASYLNKPDVLFIATNTDERFPADDTGIVIPGSGTMVAAVQTCALREPFIIGKPHAYVSEAISEKYGVNPGRTLMIGDRCNTDILLGKRCGYQTLLVLSGVTTLPEVEEWKCSSKKEDNDLVPDVYLPTLGDLLQFLK